MRKAHGYATITSPDPSVAKLDGKRVDVPAGVFECDTIQCGHCGRVVHVQARQKVEDIGGFCRQCMSPVCPSCLETGRCDPLEKKLERAEARDRTLRSYGL